MKILLNYFYQLNYSTYNTFHIIFNLSLFLLCNNTLIIIDYTLMTILGHEYKFYILLVWMSSMFFTVSLISSLVLWYSFSYMMMDKNKTSFCWMVLLFIFPMLLLF